MELAIGAADADEPRETSAERVFSVERDWSLLAAEIEAADLSELKKIPAKIFGLLSD